MASQGLDAARLHDPDGEGDRLQYFELLLESFGRASAAMGGTADRYFSIADRVVCVRSPTPSLVDVLTRALAHCAIPARQPDFTIGVWDDASTGTRLPLLLRSLVHLCRAQCYDVLNPRREIKDYNGERIRTSFFVGPDILSALDLQRDLGLYWIGSEDQLPYWERGSPFLALLSWWMASERRYYVHAGAVGHADGGVLLAGRGGSGKSTTALACLASDLVYASDDYCIVSNDVGPVVHSVYSTAKLKGHVDFDRFPHLRERCSNLELVGDEKALLFLQDHYADRIVRGFPICAVLLPRVNHSPHARVTSATSAEAFRALAPSTLMQVPGAGPELLEALRRLLEAVPAFHLDLGPDPASLPPLIGEILASGVRA